MVELVQSVSQLLEDPSRMTTFTNLDSSTAASEHLDSSLDLNSGLNLDSSLDLDSFP
jgi:hypothetical protein